MKLYDKIARLRKQNGWSQEELAQRLNVSRQSVSKWEGGLSSPELDKIIQMSTLFNVTTDYLLKEDAENVVAFAEQPRSAASGYNAPNYAPIYDRPAPVHPMYEGSKRSASSEGQSMNDQPYFSQSQAAVAWQSTASEDEKQDEGTDNAEYEAPESEDDAPESEYEAPEDLTDAERADLPQLSDHAAYDFVAKSHTAAVRTALGVSSCILSAAPIVAMAGFAEWSGMNEDLMAGLAVPVTLIMVAIGVFLFITSGALTEGYKYMETEPFLLDSKVSQWVQEEKEKFKPIQSRNIALGVVMCILSAIPVILMGVTGSDFLECIGVSMTLLLVAVGVFPMVRTGMTEDCYLKLAQEGKFSFSKKMRRYRRKNRRNK